MKTKRENYREREERMNLNDTLTDTNVPMGTIISHDNSKVKLINKLYEKKHRDIEKLYVSEGSRWVFDALQNAELVSFIAVKDSSYELYRERLAGFSDLVYVFSDNVFDKISAVENSQGILAVLKIREFSLPPASKHCLFLDRIRDPGNMGTIIRTAAAAGYTDIILNNCVDVYNPKVIRSSMSASLKVRFIDGSPQTLEILKKDGYKTVCADLSGENIFKYSVKPEKFVLIIGNEAEGVSGDVKRQSQIFVKIPMENIESLNAAVSAGILMYFLKYKNN